MQIVPRRPLYQRAINRLLHPYGVKFFPVAFESSLTEVAGDRDRVFDAIYETNYWDSTESGSGAGSELKKTEAYRRELVSAIREFGIRSMFDAPCGDLNWMPFVLAEVKIDYIGGDIAAAAISAAKARCPGADIRHFDICRDSFPDTDLWHCRDTFFHLSFDDIRAALRQAQNADIGYLAATTHKARFLRNMDIATGGFRLLDLERAPFNFPRAIRYVRDYSFGDFPRFVGLWKMTDLPRF